MTWGSFQGGVILHYDNGTLNRLEISRTFFNLVLASETFFVGGAGGKGKRTSGNSSQRCDFSWNLKDSWSHAF